VSTPEPVTRSDGIARNTVFALGVQGTTTVFTAVTSLVLVRILGPEEFGVFALALSLAGVVSILARFGIPGSVARFIAENRQDRDACAALLRDSVRLTLVTASLAAAALFVAAGPIADAYDNRDLVWALRGVAISMFAEALLAVYLKAFIAVGRIAVNLRLVFLESLAESAASIALVVAGTEAAGAAFGRAIGYSVGAAIAAIAAIRVFGKASRSRRQAAGEAHRKRALVGYALPLLVIDGIYGLFARVDVLVIGAILNTTAVGLYAAPLRLIPPLSSVAQAIADSVSPLQALTDVGRRVDAFVSSMRWLVVVYAGVSVPLVVWAEPIVSLLFGPDYDGSADVLRLLAPFVFLGGLAPLVSTTVNFLGEATRRIPIAVGALVTNVAIDLTLIPVIGIEAAAIGTSTAFLLYVPAHIEICRRELRFPIRPLLLTTLRAFAAAAAMGAVMVAVGGTQSLTLVTATVGAVGGVLAYGVVLVVTREVSRSEARQLARSVRRLGSVLRRPG
jgi:O-antigen/teichoic acid export membrane protein